MQGLMALEISCFRSKQTFTCTVILRCVFAASRVSYKSFAPPLQVRMPGFGPCWTLRPCVHIAEQGATSHSGYKTPPVPSPSPAREAAGQATGLPRCARKLRPIFIWHRPRPAPHLCWDESRRDASSTHPVRPTSAHTAHCLSK